MTTLDAFFTALTACHADYAWSCTAGGVVRGTREGQHFCPLTAVAYAQTGVYLHPDQHRLADAALGLPHSAGVGIVAAADNRPLHPARLDPIRHHLLAVLGLQEEATL